MLRRVLVLLGSVHLDWLVLKLPSP